MEQRDPGAEGWTGFKFVCLGNSLYSKPGADGGGQQLLPYCEGEPPHPCGAACADACSHAAAPEPPGLDQSFAPFLTLWTHGTCHLSPRRHRGGDRRAGPTGGAHTDSRHGGGGGRCICGGGDGCWEGPGDFGPAAAGGVRAYAATAAAAAAAGAPAAAAAAAAAAAPADVAERGGLCR